jgi:hypothetical protein
MSWHETWLFLWYILGMLTYMIKRGHYLITGPNPIANNWTQFIQRSWVPLGVRGLMETVAYWLLFTPQVAAAALTHLGWTNYAWVLTMAITSAPAAFFLGHGADSITDLAVSKIPWLNQILPQMPGPLQKGA